MILLFGGLAYICSRGSTYFSDKTETTLNNSSPIHCAIDCHFVGKDFDSLIFPALPEPDRTRGSLKEIRVYNTSDIRLTNISIQSESFLEPVIETVRVRGFSAIGPPLVSIKLTLNYDGKSPVKLGRWPVRFLALARLKKAYFSSNMRSLERELAQIKQGGNKEQIEASNKRLQTYKQKMAIMSWNLPIQGEGKIEIKSTSYFKGVPAGWISKILAVLALIFGGIGAIVVYLYLMKLKEGDIET